MDEDGYVWYEGRADDVIISAGYRIGPFEVESACLEHPAVAEAAAVASPDERRGFVVKAFVVPAKGYEPSDELAEEIKAFVRDHHSAYAYPRKIEFVTELPKTLTGKIRRIELREREARRVTPDRGVSLGPEAAAWRPAAAAAWRSSTAATWRPSAAAAWRPSAAAAWRSSADPLTGRADAVPHPVPGIEAEVIGFGGTGVL